MRVRVQILPLVQSAVACRLELHSALPGNKDLLYLDLALEGVVRSAMERGIGSLGMGACAFVGPLLQNLVRPHRLRSRSRKVTERGRCMVATVAAMGHQAQSLLQVMLTPLLSVTPPSTQGGSRVQLIWSQMRHARLVRVPLRPVI